jgi:hypothetical protein
VPGHRTRTRRSVLINLRQDDERQEIYVSLYGEVQKEVIGSVLAWSRLHGFVSLEIAGNYASMSINPDEVFEIQLATLTA